MKERKQSALIEKAQLERQPEAIEDKQQDNGQAGDSEAERLTRSDCLREAENALSRRTLAARSGKGIEPQA